MSDKAIQVYNPGTREISHLGKVPAKQAWGIEFWCQGPM